MLKRTRFTDNIDSTVKDNATVLIEQKCIIRLNATACSGTVTPAARANAITYYSGLSFAGKTWRLPQMSELKCKVDTIKASGFSRSLLKNFRYLKNTFENFLIFNPCKIVSNDIHAKQKKLPILIFQTFRFSS